MRGSSVRIRFSTLFYLPANPNASIFQPIHKQMPKYPSSVWLVITLLAACLVLYFLRNFLPNDLESWFSYSGLVAMIGGVILIFGPRLWPLLSIFPAYVFPAVLSLGYVILILCHFGPAEGGYNTLADVAKLLSPL